MTDAPLSEDDVIAAEYVLGALDLAARAAAETRARTDAGFAVLIAAWEQRLSGLNDDYAEAVAPDLLPRIEARLFARAGKISKTWLNALAGLALSTAVALGVAAFLLVSPPAATLTASLTDAASPLRYDAQIAGDTLTISHVAGDLAGFGHDYELWVIAGDNAPVSLGVIADGRITIAAPVAEAGFVLAITLEPAGGSPTGNPTGPVVALGKLIGI